MKRTAFTIDEQLKHTQREVSQLYRDLEDYEDFSVHHVRDLLDLIAAQHEHIRNLHGRLLALEKKK